MSLLVKNNSGVPVTLAAGAPAATLDPGEIFDCTGEMSSNVPADWAALEAQRAPALLQYSWNGPEKYSTNVLQLDYTLVVPAQDGTKDGLVDSFGDLSFSELTSHTIRVNDASAANAGGGSLVVQAARGGPGSATLPAGSGGSVVQAAGDAGTTIDPGGPGFGGSYFNIAGKGGDADSGAPGVTGANNTSQGGPGGNASAAQIAGDGGGRASVGGSGGNGTATQPGGSGGAAALIGGAPGIDNGSGTGAGGDAIIDAGPSTVGGRVAIGTNNGINLLGRPGVETKIVPPVKVPYGAVLTSAASISPTDPIHHVDGVAAIDTIKDPYVGFEGTIILIPDSLWTWTVAGNIAVAGAAVVGKALFMVRDQLNDKWYPSYLT